MARIWYEGFCNQNNATDLVAGVLSTISVGAGAFSLVSPGRFFGKAMSFTTGADAVGVPAYWTKVFTQENYNFLHLAVQPQTPTNGATATSWIAFFDGTSSLAQCSVGIDNTSGTVTIYQGYGPGMINAGGDGLLVLATSAAGVVPINAYSSIEVGLVIGTGTTGSLTVKVNSSIVVQATGVQTQRTGNGYWTTLQAGVTLTADGSTGAVATTLFTDAYLGNSAGTTFNTYVTPVTVCPRIPTAEDLAQFLPKSGTNVSQVDETAMDSYATYNYAQTVGAEDTFSSSQTLPSGYVPISLKVQVAAASDLGVNRQVETVLISGTATVTGSSVVAESFFGYTETYADVDPNTSTAWTAASVDATYFGYKQSA